MRNARKALMTLAAFGMVLAFGRMAAADTLQLKDGTVVQGKYLGGSERAMQFEVNGNVSLYSVSDVISLTFTGTPAAATSPSAVTSPTGNLNASVAPQTTPSYTAPQSSTSGSAASSATTATTTTNTSGNSASNPIVPAGTEILVRMIDSVDSKTNHVGDRFHASLEADVTANGVTVAPKGADVYGRLADAEQAGHITGKAQLKLELTEILINNRLQPVMTGEYELAGSSRGTNTAKKAGGGAAIGAVIGAIAGGGKGAAIGAGVGAGAGTAVNVATEGEQVNVPSETVLEFRLQQPFTPQVN